MLGPTCGHQSFAQTKRIIVKGAFADPLGYTTRQFDDLYAGKRPQRKRLLVNALDCQRLFSCENESRRDAPRMPPAHGVQLRLPADHEQRDHAPVRELSRGSPIDDGAEAQEAAL
jgi:hypothetical protein